MTQSTYDSNKEGLSEKALENLKRNAEARQRLTSEKGYIFLRDGEEIIRVFDLENTELREIDYEGNGKKKLKTEYTVKHPETGEPEIFRATMKTSRDIDALLAKDGFTLLRIRREGKEKHDTRYYVTLA